MKHIYYKKYFWVVALSLLTANSCKKEDFILQPQDAISSSSLATNPKAPEYVLNGILRSMRMLSPGSTSHDDFGVKAFDMAMDLISGDMGMAKSNHMIFDYQIDNRSATYRRTQNMWIYFYSLIGNANSILDGGEKVKAEYRGQALALRAYCHFYLVNLYQHAYTSTAVTPATTLGIPIYTTSSSSVGAKRSTIEEVYAQCIDDLNKAIVLLEGYTPTDKSYLRKETAQGILARVYLMKGDWAKAFDNASAVINSNKFSLMGNTDYAAGFNSYTNPEWIWGLPFNDNEKTSFASFFSQIDNTGAGYAGAKVFKFISKSLYDNFEASDIRKSVFAAPLNSSESVTAGAYAQLKFRDPASGAAAVTSFKTTRTIAGGSQWLGHYLLMRLSEMYLICAEAKARLGEDATATNTYLNILRTKRGASNITDVGTALINKILLERRLELWGEGFGLFDIKRTNSIIDRTGSNHLPAIAIKMSVPANDKFLYYQIPQREIDANPLIIQQD